MRGNLKINEGIKIYLKLFTFCFHFIVFVAILAQLQTAGLVVKLHFAVGQPCRSQPVRHGCRGKKDRPQKCGRRMSRPMHNRRPCRFSDRSRQDFQKRPIHNRRPCRSRCSRRPSRMRSDSQTKCGHRRTVRPLH